MTEVIFKSLDILLEQLGITHHAKSLERGRFEKQGEYYEKSRLVILGTPNIITPGRIFINEPDFERYIAVYGGNKTFTVVLPIRKDGERDRREPVFVADNELARYFLAENIGYFGYKEMTFPDSITVLKSTTPFSLDGFNELSKNKTFKELKLIDFYLYQENYSPQNKTDNFRCWERRFENVTVTQVNADNGIKNKYNPIYFLVIHR